MPAERTRLGGEVALLLAALAAIVIARSLAMRAGIGNGIEIGLAFGLALVVVSWAAARRRQRRMRATRATLVAGCVGLAGGIALVALALLARAANPDAPAIDRFGPNVPFVGWALATTIVAVAEETLLRGALFDRLAVGWGPGLAIVAAAIAFALMHVPTYGWTVVPLDLGVGLWLGGLRVLARSVLAPAIAHVVADLATWWL
jgi:membrane protease YdiL (CAAX protease family)